jgi:integrase
MTKIDPHKHKQKYETWKERVKQGIPNISKANSDLIKSFIYDMEHGLNIATGSKKGARSFIRLNTLRDKMGFFARTLEKNFKLNVITDVSEEQIHIFFNMMRNGKILRADGNPYQSVHYYVKSFKSFWHWYMKVQKKKRNKVLDITTDLDTQSTKPKWVYISEENLKKLCDNARYEHKVLMMFLFDTGIRSPTELVNIKVNDITDNYKKLNVRDEVSKTFGRRINLMISSELIKDYVRENGLKPEDYIFPISPPVVNKYLKRLAQRILGEEKSLAGEPYHKMTMYDFRHSSACYWLPRYKSESALKYRFGWKKSEMIHYYTEFLGMKDTISEEDMLIDVTKTEIERRLEQSEKDKQILQDKISSMENQMSEMTKLVNSLFEKENTLTSPIKNKIKIIQTSKV